MNYFEFILSLIFFFDFSLSLFLADHKLEFFSSFYSMIDLFTCIPILFIYNNKCPKFDEINTFYDGFIYLMYMLNVTRILRALRVRKYLFTIEDEVQRHLGEMCLIFIVMILFDAALMQFLESYLDRGLDFKKMIFLTVLNFKFDFKMISVFYFCFFNRLGLQCLAVLCVCYPNDSRLRRYRTEIDPRKVCRHQLYFYGYHLGARPDHYID